jgi:RND family efflux transporter MFP subunit
VFLKFPTVLRSRAESTAYASLSDVVRSIPVKVGDQVHRDQVIVNFSSDNPAYQQALVNFESAEAAFQRSSALFAEAGISRQDFDNARTRYELAKASLKSARDMIEVKAPIDGYLTRINVRPTENVRPGAALFTVSNQDGYEARFYVGADQIDLIKAGARARIEERGETVMGSIVEVSLIIDADKKAFPVTAFFAGKPRGLVSGMSADVAVETYRNEKALVVARKELVRSGSSYAAYVARNGVAKRIVVAHGRERGLDMEIVGGLEAGDVLISEGVQGLSDEAPIKVVPSIASL